MNSEEMQPAEYCWKFLLVWCLLTRAALGQSLTNLGITPLPEMRYAAYKGYPGAFIPITPITGPRRILLPDDDRDQ